MLHNTDTGNNRKDYLYITKILLADKEFLSTEVVVVDDDVETSPNTEFMFEEFWTEWLVDDVAAAKLLAFKTLELLVVLVTSYEC